MKNKETKVTEQMLRCGWLPDGGEVTLTPEIQNAFVWTVPYLLQWWIDLSLLAGTDTLYIVFLKDGSIFMKLRGIIFDEYTLAARWAGGIGAVMRFLNLLYCTSDEPWQTIRIEKQI